VNGYRPLFYSERNLVERFPYGIVLR
jgi:hypothetical protein